MAEKVCESTSKQDVPLENKTLEEEVLQLVFKRLIGGGNESKVQATCARILQKRKQKWRKRHKQATGATVLQPSVSTLYQEHEKKTTLTETAMSLHNELTQKRKEGLKAARQLQTEKCDQNLDVIKYRLKQTGESLQCLQTFKSSSMTADTNSSARVDQHQLIKDLQTAVSQAKALQDIQKMKLHMTPRVPPIWAGAAKPDDYLLDTDKTPGDLTDSNNNCNIPVALTTEVSTTSLSQELIQVSTTPLSQELIQESLSMPISFLPSETNLQTCIHPSDTLPGVTDCTTASDSDIPGISLGMEVVCAEGLNGTVGLSIGSSSSSVDADIVMASSGGSSLSPNGTRLPGPSQDTSVNESLNVGVTSSGKRQKVRRTPVTKKHKLDKTPTPRAMRTRSGILNTSISSNSVDTEISEAEDEKEYEITETDTDSDSQMCKMLRVLERTPYELRIPKRNSGGRQTYSYNNNTISLTGDSRLRSKRKRSFIPIGKRT